VIDWRSYERNGQLALFTLLDKFFAHSGAAPAAHGFCSIQPHVPVATLLARGAPQFHRFRDELSLATVNAATSLFSAVAEKLGSPACKERSDCNVGFKDNEKRELREQRQKFVRKSEQG